VSTRVDRKDFFAIFNGFDFVLPSGGFATLPVNDNYCFLGEGPDGRTSCVLSFRAALLTCVRAALPR
jgi:hypothetical protein